MTTFDQLVRATFSQALGIASDHTVELRVRERAASLAAEVTREFHLTEADATALLAAVPAVLDLRLGLSSLVWVAVDESPKREAAAAGVLRLTERVYREGPADALPELVSAALFKEVAIECAWFEQAFRSAVGSARPGLAAGLLVGWLENGRQLSAEVCVLVAQRHEQLLVWRHLHCRERLEMLHAAAPTPTGWRRLVQSVGDGALPLAAETFGDKLADARRTLLEAIDNADEASRATLARWMGELNGGSDAAS